MLTPPSISVSKRTAITISSWARLSRQVFYAWRRAVFSTLIVFGGIATAAVTFFARRAGADDIARLAALCSLAFVLLMLVFVVPPLARAARAEIGRISVSVRITVGGAIFLSIVAIVAFAAWNTGNNLLFMILSILVSTIFVSWAAGRAALIDVAVSARFPDHIFAGEAETVVVMLRNAKRLLPSLSILIKANANRDAARPEKQPAIDAATNLAARPLAYFMYVPHRGRAEQHVETIFPRRGRVIIDGFEISTGFPFGFFRFRRRLPTRDVELIVYPKPEPAGDELNLLPMNVGRLSSARRGQGSELHSLRDYKAQDDLRFIDWKATARARQLIVREFTAEDERRVQIMLDTRPPQNLTDEDQSSFTERFERGVVLAASLVAHFTDEQAEVVLTLGDEQGERGSGREHLYHCLRRLALVAPAAPLSTDVEKESGFLKPRATSSIEANSIADSGYHILLTTAAPGSIPAHIWRSSHVIHL